MALSADDPGPEQTYRYFTDNMPTEPPRRVVSVVPSMTETLFELGLGSFVVGVSDDCLFPAEAVAAKFRLGPMDALNIQHIVDLRPDVVIVNREENTLADITLLQGQGLHVWQTFPRTVPDAMNLIWDTLHLFMVDDRYLYEKVNLINRTMDWVGGVSEAREDHICKVFVPLLLDPLTTFGADTYAHDLLRLAGGTNVFGKYSPDAETDPAEDVSRYPVITIDEVQNAQPDIILLPSAPLPFLETDIMWFNQQLDVPATRNEQVYWMDGSLFTYHSVRLARALNEFSALMCDVEEMNDEY